MGARDPLDIGRIDITALTSGTYPLDKGFGTRPAQASGHLTLFTVIEFGPGI